METPMGRNEINGTYNWKERAEERVTLRGALVVGGFLVALMSLV